MRAISAAACWFIFMSVSQKLTVLMPSLDVAQLSIVCTMSDPFAIK